MTGATGDTAIPIRGSRFAIIGGASLVGVATAELFLERGAVGLKLFDNFSFGTHKNIQHFVSDKRVSVISGDVTRLPDVLAALEGVDGVLNLAALMTISMNANPWVGLDVNICGAQNVIEACRVNRVRKLVFASSNAVYGYGSGVQGNLTEDVPFHYSDASPASALYGASKIIGEQLCRHAHQRFGLTYMVLRYSTVYGERQHQRAANSAFMIDAIDSIARGDPPQLSGTGVESKHYVYVGDVARANAAAFESSATNEAVNISGPEPVTMLEVVNLLLSLSKSTLSVQLKDPAGKQSLLSVGGAFRIAHNKAGRVLGWKPETDIAEGLRRLTEWRRAELAAKTQ